MKSWCIRTSMQQFCAPKITSLKTVSVTDACINGRLRKRFLTLRASKSGNSQGVRRNKRVNVDNGGMLNSRHLKTKLSQKSSVPLEGDRKAAFAKHEEVSRTQSTCIDEFVQNLSNGLSTSDRVSVPTDDKDKAEQVNDSQQGQHANCSSKKNNGKTQSQAEKDESFKQYPDIPSFCVDEDYSMVTDKKSRLIIQSSRKIFKSPHKAVILPPKEISIHAAYQYYMQNTNPLERCKLTNSIFNTELNAQWLEDKDLIMKTVNSCPPEKMRLLALPQICMCGKSNVGKSSLLNALMGKKFDKFDVSKKPGKTKFLKFLQIGNHLAIVDTPGYGYAKMPKDEIKQVESRIAEYLTSPFPRRAYVLLDARRGFESADKELVDRLESVGLTYTFVLTKCDKVSNSKIQSLESELQRWIRKRVCAVDGILVSSSVLGLGIDQIRSSIYMACELNMKKFL